MISAGLSAPRDNMAASALRALRHDSPAVSARVIGVTSWPLKIVILFEHLYLLRYNIIWKELPK